MSGRCLLVCCEWLVGCKYRWILCRKNLSKLKLLAFSVCVGIIHCGRTHYCNRKKLEIHLPTSPNFMHHPIPNIAESDIPFQLRTLDSSKLFQWTEDLSHPNQLQTLCSNYQMIRTNRFMAEFPFLILRLWFHPCLEVFHSTFLSSTFIYVNMRCQLYLCLFDFCWQFYLIHSHKHDLSLSESQTCMETMLVQCFNEVIKERTSELQHNIFEVVTIPCS